MGVKIYIIFFSSYNCEFILNTIYIKIHAFLPEKIIINNWKYFSHLFLSWFSWISWANKRIFFLEEENFHEFDSDCRLFYNIKLFDSWLVICKIE
jgi:hypothetical protein